MWNAIWRILTWTGSKVAQFTLSKQLIDLLVQRTCKFQDLKSKSRFWSVTPENRWSQMSQISFSEALEFAVWGWLEWKYAPLNGAVCEGLILNWETQLCLTPREQKSRALLYLCPTSRTSRLKTHISVIVLFECTLLPLIYVPVPLCMFTCLYSVSLCHHQRFYITLSSFYIKLFNICSIY